MPYRWTDAEGHAVPSPASDSTTAADQLHLWPYRSLPRKGFVFFIVATVAMISLPLFAVLGRVELWWLLPFIALAVAGVWWAISHSYRTGEVLEVLSFRGPELHLIRHDPGKRPRDWEANPHWVRVEMHPSGGPVPDYLTLRGGTREVEIGAFLTPEERRQLHRELQLRLDQARAPAAS
ncbi:hypothetical protein BMI90_02390 [Thioclava sp. L04-15]|jgi:uncharacterized membrane protein|uniref:DUF2244 domain-containing protein n=1 Tax=Thioclava sp. L04-15 TaxID=1915318 RepID=UPI000996DF52|nr:MULTISPECIES: DUF2244 domain-containing protein [unclassified Thioclava]MBD3803289.1 DUF2244 domain-containing protein [Thioclava sp.]OOY29132.1 hypothetical protein BMI90_02390 [Thioclava sp. L04-15]TNE93860.1 MAG: DUF2244 domain-containing protein [Paracoccaceae bacterium]